MEAIVAELIHWRAIERIVSILIGGIAILCGWQLFLKGVVDQQTAEIESQSFKVRLHKVGPGIFFALFGSALIAHVATTNLEFRSNDFSDIGKAIQNNNGVLVGASGKKPISLSIAYAANQPTPDSLKLSASVQKLRDHWAVVNEALTARSTDPSIVRDLNESLARLESVNRNQLLKIFPGNLRDACLNGGNIPANYSEDHCISLREHAPRLFGNN